MISEEFRFVYVHTQKTGGNALSRAFLPISNNKIYLEKFHDGVNQFGVRGTYSDNKHAPLSVYARHLGKDFPQYSIILSVRHPFPRALSFYFSPHRWYRKGSDNTWTLTEPYWNESEFRALFTTEKLAPMSSYLDAAHNLNAFYLIKNEFLAKDLKHVCKKIGIPVDRLASLEKVNVTCCNYAMMARLLKSKILKDEVKEFFQNDMQSFAYESYAE